MEYCAQHAPDRMVDVKNRKCKTQGCGKIPSFGVARTKTAEYCVQHAPESMVNVFRMKCRTECCEKTPSFGVTGSRDSRKRVRHPEITSTMSKRAVARESTAGAVTMPDIDGQKSPVRRNSCVKTEVQLSF